MLVLQHSLFKDSLADARQLLANLYRNHAIGAHGSSRNQHPLVFGCHLADAGCVTPERMPAQNFQNRIRSLGSDEEHRFALIGDVHRIEAQ